MIGNLLKQLPAAFGRYIWYHCGRIFGPAKFAPPEAHVQAAAEATTAGGPKEALNLKRNFPLNPAYLEHHDWPRYRSDTPPVALSCDPLYQLWAATTGGQKWSQYFSIYREVFGPLTDKPMRILEIGVYFGASLDLWRKYFSHSDTIIVGVDINPFCAQFDAPKQGKFVRIGSQTDERFLAGVIDEFGPFDLIIDDGSHQSGDVIVSFNSLFSPGLKDSGIYFVEDLHAAFWEEWQNSKNTFFDICKELVDHMHAPYKIAGPKEFFIERPSDHPSPSLRVPHVTTMIREIRFFDSIVAIYKTRSEHAPFAVRMDYVRGADFVSGRMS